MSFADLDGKDEEPTPFLTGRHAAPEGWPNTSVHTPPQEGGGLVALPESIVFRIAAFSTRQEVIALASLCHRFNKLIPAHIFSQSQLDVQRTNAEIVFSMDIYQGKVNTDPNHLVPHLLAISFWIKSVDVIRYQFGRPLADTVRDMGHIAGFISRMPIASIRELRIDFRPVDIGNYKSAYDPPGLDPRKWMTAVNTLMQAAQERRVKDVFLLNGRYLSDMLESNEVHRPPHTREQTNVYNRKKLQNPLPISPPSAEPTPSRFKGLFSGLRRGASHKPSPSMSQTKPPENPAPSKGSFDNFLPTVPSPPLGLNFLPANAKDPNATTPYAPQVLESQTTKPKAVARATPLFQPKPYEDLRGIRALHLDSPIFLMTDYIQSTTKFVMLRPFSMTTLSLIGYDVDSSAWKSFLDAIHLPSLASFIIRSSSTVQKGGAAASDLIKFLLRHRTITYLDMYGMGVPSYIDELIDAPTILPSLSQLSAHPTYVSVITANHARKPSFRSPLSSIKISSESYGRLHPLFSYRPSQPDMILKALEHVAELTGPIELRLGFSLDDTTHMTWIEEALGNYTAASNVCAKLKRIERLSLDCGYNVTLSKNQITAVLPAFFNSLPALETVYLRDMGPCEAMSGPEIRELWARMCPKLRRVEVTNVWKTWSPAPIAVHHAQDDSAVGTSEQAIG